MDPSNRLIGMANAEIRSKPSVLTTQFTTVPFYFDILQKMGEINLRVNDVLYNSATRCGDTLVGRKHGSGIRLVV
jgi:hypothetical protein